MKTDNFIRDAIESINIEEQDSWSSSNALLLMALSVVGKKDSNASRTLDNLLRQIPVDKRFAAVACFGRLDKDEAEMKNRLNGLKVIMDQDVEANSIDPLLLTFYTKYETKIAGKGHYQHMLETYLKMEQNQETSLPVFGVAVIEGIESVDQAVYEYYDALKKLYKANMAKNLECYKAGKLDASNKALVAYALLKACRLKVVLTEKYEELALKMAEEVLESASEEGLNKGAISLLLAEKNSR